MANAPRGLCLACGFDTAVLRLDKRSMPYVVCLTCTTRTFVKGEGAAERYFGALVVLAEHYDLIEAEAVAATSRVADWLTLAVAGEAPIERSSPRRKLVRQD